MPTHVLVVDPNESFAALLKEGLEADPEFRVMSVPDSAPALAALQSNTFDLAIVDLGLETLIHLLRAIRDLQPDLPIMVIPLDGDLVPQELAPFEIKGVLTKPFFLPDLPGRVAEVLGRPLPTPVPAPLPAASAPRPSEPANRPPRPALPRVRLSKDDPRVAEALSTLAEAVNAETVLLTDGDVLLAHAGPLGRPGTETIAQRILRSRAVRSSWVASGGEQVRFGQSISDSGEHLLYSVDVAEDVVLTVAVQPNTSLRLVRAKTRQTAEALLALSV